MKILAVDTSTMMSSIAVLDDDTIIGDLSINQEETHSEMLVPNIKRLLEDLKISLNDIDLLAIAKGPGSFTGLRIGMTTIKAIAQAKSIPIIGVSTLEAMAFSILNDSYIVPIIDARATRYFAGVFKWENGKLINYFQGLIEEDVLLENIKDKESVLIVGEAISKIPDSIKNMKNVNLAHPALNNGIAKNIAVIAKNRFEQGLIDDTFDIEPDYLRKSQAEINFEKQNI